MKKMFILVISLFIALHADSRDYQHALSLYMEDKYEESIIVINDLLRKDSSVYQLYFLKGKIQERLFKYKEAIEAHEKSNLLQENKESISALAGLYMEIGQPMKAATLYQRLDKLDPKVSNRISLGTSLFKAGHFHQALEVFSEILSLDSTNWLVYKYQGDCFARLNLYNRTINSYRVALDFYPEQLELQTKLSSLYLNCNKLDSAEMYAQNAITKDGNNIEGLRCMGIVRFRQNEINESQKYFKQLIKIGDSSLLVLNYMGILAYQKSEIDDAELFLDKSLVLDRENINTLYYLSICKRKLHKNDDAFKLLSKLDTIFMRNDSIKLLVDEEYGYLYRGQHEHRKSADIFRSLLNRKPSHSKYYYEVAVSYDLSLDKSKALIWYKQFLNKLDPAWETKVLSDEERKRTTYKNVALNRVEALTIDLFHEDKLEEN